LQILLNEQSEHIPMKHRLGRTIGPVLQSLAHPRRHVQPKW
jgi:hypothetical protein